jgi:hypothetical protein
VAEEILSSWHPGRSEEEKDTSFKGRSLVTYFIHPCPASSFYLLPNISPNYESINE